MKLRRLQARIKLLIWDQPVHHLPGWKKGPILFVRVLAVLARDVTDGQLTLRAMSLVYTTLLSLVPLLALSFSVLKAFGVHNQIQPLLYSFLAPLGEKGAELTDLILGFVENMKVGVLGSLGLALLIYTVVSLVQKVERSFNYIWRVGESRHFAQRFTGYLSTIIIGPVLVFAALGLTASVMSSTFIQHVLGWRWIGPGVLMASKAIPYLLVIGLFTFLYAFMPNTKVRIGAALAGGIVAGVLWESAGWGFALFVVNSTKYAAIYSSFAILIMFMIWLYVSWLILLLGADIAFYIQNPEYLARRRWKPELTATQREKLGLVAYYHIAERHYHGGTPWTLHALTRALGVPMEGVRAVLRDLEKAELLLETSSDPAGYVPSRDVGTISAREVLDAVRGYATKRPAFDCEAAPEVQALLERVHEATRQVTSSASMRDLIVADAPPLPLSIATERRPP